MPNLHWGWVSIVSRCHTWLKSVPIDLKDLPFDGKAKILPARSIRRCKVLDRKNKHTYLETGLGKWWIEDAHWDGLTDEAPTVPYSIDRDLIYLKDFPYFHQNSDEDGWKLSQSASLAMCLKYLNSPVINSHSDYLELINKHGKPTLHDSNFKLLRELGVNATYTLSADDQDIKDEIHKGLPVVAKLVIGGTVSRPYGGYQFVVIIGYGLDYWLVQDPLGSLDLENGYWKTKDSYSGNNIRYSFDQLNPRFMTEGGSTGSGWFNFNYV